MKKMILALGATAALIAAPASAAVFQGADSGPASRASIPNSDAAAAAFLAAAGPVTTITFESFNVSAATPLVSGIATIAGSNYISAQQVVKNVSECTFALCGGNTTSGGANFLSIYGGSATVTFSSAVSGFGFYLGGIQMPNTVTYFDGAEHVVNFNGSNDYNYIGVTGSNISWFRIDARNDILALDDVSYAVGGAVPEAATWAMMLGGLGLAGAALRRRKAAVSFA